MVEPQVYWEGVAWDAPKFERLRKAAGWKPPGRRGFRWRPPAVWTEKKPASSYTILAADAIEV